MINAWFEIAPFENHLDFDCPWMLPYVFLNMGLTFEAFAALPLVNTTVTHRVL